MHGGFGKKDILKIEYLKELKERRGHRLELLIKKHGEKENINKEEMKNFVEYFITNDFNVEDESEVVKALNKYCVIEEFLYKYYEKDSGKFLKWFSEVYEEWRR